jgi:hypothetical protein
MIKDITALIASATDTPLKIVNRYIMHKHFGKSATTYSLSEKIYPGYPIFWKYIFVFNGNNRIPGDSRNIVHERSRKGTVDLV